MGADMHDIIVVGAGLGGLMAAAKLVRAGARVLVLEKKALPGGTSYVFRRGGYAFPMGPLSFSFPGRVREFLSEAGIDDPPRFVRSRFALKAPGLDVPMSVPLDALEVALASRFPAERAGLAAFFLELRGIMAATGDLDRWHPDFVTGRAAAGTAGERSGDRARRIDELARTPSAALLDRLIGDRRLRDFLGSMGTERPSMSLLNLGLMWRIMAEEGIWFPSCGIHGLADLLVERIRAGGGEVRLAAAVRRILVRGGRAAGVLTADGLCREAAWVISNADHKTTFLELIDPRDIPGVDLDAIRRAPYTGSELCVYLGLRPERVDLSALEAEHFFFRAEIKDRVPRDPEDFDDREIEICRWSAKAPDLVPEGRAALVLRAGLAHGRFATLRLGEKARRKGYRELKSRLAERLVRTAERACPGLSAAVEVIETATPLTYQDWGGRFEGSIAGWSWGPTGAGRLSRRLLVRTDVGGLLAVGAYAATELVLGGVPTALLTGSRAADVVLDRPGPT